MKKMHVIPHMHWDREWYFTTEESRILLVNNMEEIMERLETDPNYPYYVLDGQTSILEDYFAVKPENKERIKKLVQAGKLIIGPWYTQTDEMVVGGESIVRNLLYGIKDCEAFGDYMKIGYLPDSFGQSSQMPQILNGFDIKYSIFWRGTSERHGTDKTEFYWTSDEGSKVLVQLLPLGYAIGKYLPEEPNALKTRMEKYLPVLDRGATTAHQVLPNGHDQMPIQKNIYEVMDQLRALYPDREFFLSKYEHVLAEVEKNPDLDTISGEFLDGKYMRVHRSIYSTRMDIKAANTRIENKITNLLEPLAVIAHSMGFEYHHGLIELIWKEIMKNHAHDSIGCCCSDKVHQEIFNRFFLAEEKTDRLIDFYKRQIVDGIQTERTEDRLTAFNLLPYPRQEVLTTTIISKFASFALVDENGTTIPFDLLKKEEMDPGLIDRQIVHYGNYDPFMKYEIQFEDELPAMGYKTYFIVETSEALTSAREDVKTVETDFFTISVNGNGSLAILDKQTGKYYQEVFLLENGGDDGDEYDFSPLPGETLIYSRDVQAASTIKHNQYGALIQVEMELQVPFDLDQRQAQLRDGRVGVKMSITIPHHKPILEVKLELDNQAKDHRLRLLTPLGLTAKYSLSDNQFGTIQRDVYDAAMDVWEKEGWDERPDAIYPMLSFVGASNESHGAAILTNSSREFEIVHGKQDYDTVAITLFRSVGFLGKEEMLRRPGRPSGIKLPTPDSQLLGKLELELALYYHGKSTLEANTARMAKEFTTPIQFYNKIPYNAMKLNPSGIKTPASFSFMTETGDSLVLSALKKAEKSDHYIVRYFNGSKETQELQISKDVKEAYLTNLNEVIMGEVSNVSGQMSASLAVNQVKTLMFSI